MSLIHGTKIVPQNQMGKQYLLSRHEMAGIIYQAMVELCRARCPHCDGFIGASDYITVEDIEKELEK